MSKRYEPQNIEKKWQKIWQDEKAFAATDDYTKPKYYALVEFPYPSGQGLHVGHPRPYTALDIEPESAECRATTYCIRWDGMHSVFRQKTMQLRWVFTQKVYGTECSQY